MITKHNVHFLTHGYTIIPNALSPDELKRAQEAFDRVAEKPMTEWKQKVSQGKAPEYFNIDNIFDADDIFVDLVNHPATFPVVRGAIGEDVQLEGASGRIYPPGPTYSPWHRDTHGFLGVDLDNSPSFRAKLHYFLADVPENRGCLGYVPGSHRFPPADMPQVEQQEDMPGHVRLAMKAGDALLIHIHGWHTVFPNTSDQPRKSLIFTYSHFWMKQSETARPTHLQTYLDDPVKSQLFGVGDPVKSYKGQRLSAISKA